MADICDRVVVKMVKLQRCDYPYVGIETLLELVFVNSFSLRTDRYTQSLTECT